MGAAALLDGYRNVEVASVSDAMEKIAGLRMYMSHRMDRFSLPILLGSRSR